VILILFAASRPKESLRAVAARWYLIVPSVVAFAAYSLTFSEFRYMPPWLLIVWGCVLSGLRLRNGFVHSGATRWAAGLAAVATLAPLGYGIYSQEVHGRQDDAKPQYLIAERLREMGAVPGEKVGVIGWDNDVHWAYMDRLAVVAEIGTGDACSFWDAPPSIQHQILQKFAAAGARIVVANADKNFKSTSRVQPVDLGTCSRPGPGWQTIEGTPELAYLLY
jgi:hypothetical protein